MHIWHKLSTDDFLKPFRPELKHKKNFCTNRSTLERITLLITWVYDKQRRAAEGTETQSDRGFTDDTQQLSQGAAATTPHRRHNTTNTL